MKTGRRVLGGRWQLITRGRIPLVSDFGRTLQALAAEDLLDLLPVFHHLHLVQVGPEGAPGRLHGEAAITSKTGCLATVFTLCHRPRILSSIEYSRSSGANVTTHHPSRSSRSDVGARSK